MIKAASVGVVAAVTAGVLVLVLAVAGIVGVVAGTAVGIGAALKENPANCNAPVNIFDAWEVLKSFLEGEPECECGDGSSAGGGTAPALDAKKAEYVQTIIGVQKAMGLSEKAGHIALATALVESNLQLYANDGVYDTSRNPADATLSSPSAILAFAKLSLKYPHDAVGSDASSVGLFQQQAWWGAIGSSTWESDPEGTMKRLMDPTYGAQKFLTTMVNNVPNWETLEGGSVAQKVQVSAFPDKYAQRMPEAIALYNQHKGNAKTVKLYDLGATPPGSGVSGSSDCSTHMGEPGILMDKGPLYQMTTQWAEDRTGWSSTHTGVDIDCDDNSQPVYTPLDAIVLIAKDGVSGEKTFANAGDVQVRLKDGSRLRFHHGNKALVKPGQSITAGTAVMECGDTGFSFGTHLHLEYYMDSSTNSKVAALPNHPLGIPGLKDPLLALNLLGANTCPPYVERYQKVPVGTPLGGFVKCWPPEEWTM